MGQAAAPPGNTRRDWRMVAAAQQKGADRPIVISIRWNLVGGVPIVSAKWSKWKILTPHLYIYIYIYICISRTFQFHMLFKLLFFFWFLFHHFQKKSQCVASYIFAKPTTYIDRISPQDGLVSQSKTVHLLFRTKWATKNHFRIQAPIKKLQFLGGLVITNSSSPFTRAFL